MEATIHTGYLVLADISGYTAFMAENELLHSQEITRDLLSRIVECLTPPLTLAEVEGDAVFGYVAAEECTRGETLLEVIEATYVAFRDRIMTMQRQTTCECRACRTMPSLDLKFVTHLGQYVIQSFAGKPKPVGSDVNLSHRLLKNTVADATGWRAYALFTLPTVERLGVPAGSFHEGTEHYEHFGEIPTLSVDLQKRYAEIVEGRRVIVSLEEADVTLTHDFAAPPPIVWEWLHDPDKRNRWALAAHWSPGARIKGRSGPGADNHCAHGKRIGVERILDWRPFDYATSETVDGPITMLCTDRLISIAEGTRLQSSFHLKLPLPRWLARPLARFLLKKVAKIEESWTVLARLLMETRNEKTTAMGSPTGSPQLATG